MRVWITSFVILFSIAELYQWLKHCTLPLPVFILAGALLAIASNYGKYSTWSFWSPPVQSDTHQVQTPTIGNFPSTPNWKNLNPSAAKPLPQPPRSISFTIHPTIQKGAKNGGEYCDKHQARH
jgi:hypothetical protein